MTVARRKKRWSFSTGERSRNRVRAFEHPATGRLFLEFSDCGKRKRIALGHRDREAAKAKAEKVATALRQAEAPLSSRPTLQLLFDIYLREVTPEKGVSKRQHDQRAARMFQQFFGLDRTAETLNRRDWDGFIRWRRQGGYGTRSVRNRVIEYDLKFLHAVLNWAATARDGSGGVLLERNPLRGMPWPRETSARRPVVTENQYQALLKASRRVSPLFKLALILAHETGHRIGSIRLLRWSDVDFDKGTVRWRGDSDKIGLEHVTLLTPAALRALQGARAQRPSIGDAWIFPSPGDPRKPCSRHLLRT